MSRLGTLRQTRRERQRERHQTKGLLRKTMAVPVHYNEFLVYFFAVLCKTTWNDQILRCLENVNHKTAIFSYFYFELNSFVAYSAGASFSNDRHTG